MIREWAAAEMAPWIDSRLDTARVDAEIEQVARRSISTFIFAIGDGRAYLDDKQSWPEPHFPTDDIRVRRAYAYVDFFQKCCDAVGIRGSGRFVIDMEDLTEHELNLPIFSFQKSWSSRNILLPDVDFLHSLFYLEEKYNDRKNFDEKRNEAVFVGSTSGDLPLTARHITELTSARIRAAVHFRDVPVVRFDLPNIVQCDSEETRRMVIELGVTGQPATWEEQLDYRYLISIDGNGATCARVYGALVSNSVLLKYRSDQQLFFFRGLRPWEHFIPVARERDVTDAIDHAEMDDALHRRVAAAGKAFARDNLSRVQVMTYTANLLEQYLARFGQPLQHTSEQQRLPFVLDVQLRVPRRGNVWGVPGGWARCEEDGSFIAGFRIIPGGDLTADDISYRGIRVDGTDTGWLPGHAYCGDSGGEQPLHGVALKLSARAAARYVLAYEAHFADGARASGGDGEALTGTTPLIGFRIETRIRPDPIAAGAEEASAAG